MNRWESKMRLLFTGGGTAGHINPAIAIANYFCEKEPDIEISFIGTAEGLEAGLVPQSGYKIDIIKIHGIQRRITPRNIKNICEIPFAVSAAKRIIKKFKPDGVIGTGGYVSGPVLYAAAKLGIPTFVHESNAFPGITTKILSKYVDVVALGVPEAEKFLGETKKTIITGTPLREALLKTTRTEARQKLELDDRPYIVAFGGSLGARDFNKTVANWIADVADSGKYQIIMATGKNNQYETVMGIFKERGVEPNNIKGITIAEYIYNMDVVMAGADLVISRAGASTLCELTALGKPAILVPSPYVTDNHQEHNARAVEKGGGAQVVLEKDFTTEVLNEIVEKWTSDRSLLDKISKESRKLGRPDALKTLYNEIKDLVEKK